MQEPCRLVVVMKDGTVHRLVYPDWVVLHGTVLSCGIQKQRWHVSFNLDAVAYWHDVEHPLPK